MKWIQRFYGNGECKPPTCDADGCMSRAIGMWVDAEGKAYALCRQHSQNEEPMPEDIKIYWHEQPR